MATAACFALLLTVSACVSTAQAIKNKSLFTAAAEAMRRILIDNVRRKRAARHGGGQERVDIQDVDPAATAKDDEPLGVGAARHQPLRWHLDDTALPGLVRGAVPGLDSLGQ